MIERILMTIAAFGVLMIGAIPMIAFFIYDMNDKIDVSWIILLMICVIFSLSVLCAFAGVKEKKNKEIE